MEIAVSYIRLLEIFVFSLVDWSEHWGNSK